MPVNISQDASASLAKVFRLLGQPIRAQILLVIAREEACVCHIEAALGIRQAVISQHLMVLRDAGLVASYRDGRNIFYRLANPEFLNAMDRIAAAAGISTAGLAQFSSKPLPGCPCPRCNPNLDPDMTCDKLQSS